MFDFLSGRRPSSFADRAMIATSHPLASAAGLAVLSEGGNAVDAAIAAVAVQCVADPHMTGIGGDCFVLYAPKGGAVRALNGSGRAPGRATPEALHALGATELAQTSAHSITIPGAISAWCRLHDDYGSLPLDRLFAPAIRYAEDGFPVTARVARDWARSAADLRGDPHARAHYLPGDAAPRPGERRRHPGLGATLRDIAAKGAAAFYTGPRAARMAQHCRGGLTFGQKGVRPQEDLRVGKLTGNGRCGRSGGSGRDASSGVKWRGNRASTAQEIDIHRANTVHRLSPG